jgi:hypothetical protein
LRPTEGRAFTRLKSPRGQAALIRMERVWLGRRLIAQSLDLVAAFFGRQVPRLAADLFAVGWNRGVWPDAIGLRGLLLTQFPDKSVALFDGQFFQLAAEFLAVNRRRGIRLLRAQ